MTRNKDQKRIVRARMQKTGESYTAARAVVVARKKTAAAKPDAKPDAGAGKPTYAAPRDQWPDLAGMSDDKVKEKTGRTWAQWVAALEKAGCRGKPHRDIARQVADTWPEISGWWTQMVTVGFERICGMRDVGQRPDGAWETSKSRTFAVDVSTLYTMVHDARRRRKWLPEGITKIRTATVNKTIRADWHDGSQVHFYFTAKGEGKSTLAIQHIKLAGKADIARAKALWTDRLDALDEALR